MGNDNKDTKRGFPGGFFIFLLAVILIIMAVQNLTNEKTAKVAFSHQVEHLVNLDLIQKEDSRKIALNDNLVTFSGRFKERQTDEAKARYRYLELLNKNHELVGEQQRLLKDLELSRQNVKESSDLFLHLSGLPLPKGGYTVVGSIYDTTGKDNSIVIKSLSDKEIISLADLNKRFAHISHNPTPTSVSTFGKDLLNCIQGFRSPTLGIGNESMKQQLRTIEEEVGSANSTSADQNYEPRLATYQNALNQLDAIVAELDKEQQNVRLLQCQNPIGEWWQQKRVPAFFRCCWPLVVQNGKVVHDFFTGKTSLISDNFFSKSLIFISLKLKINDFCNKN